MLGANLFGTRNSTNKIPEIIPHPLPLTNCCRGAVSNLANGPVVVRFAGYNMAATLKAAQNDHVLAGKDTKINSSTTSMGWSLKPGETRR